MGTRRCMRGSAGACGAQQATCTCQHTFSKKLHSFFVRTMFFCSLFIDFEAKNKKRTNVKKKRKNLTECVVLTYSTSRLLRTYISTSCGVLVQVLSNRDIVAYR